MKHINLLLHACILSFILFSSCKGGSVASLQNATGSPYEVLLVAAPEILKGAVGEEAKAILQSDVPGLPQAEPEFRVSALPTSEFDNLLRPVRNIFIIEISDLSTQPKFSMAKDVWSQGQMILYLKAPSAESILQFLPQQKQVIIDFFVNSEINRMITYLQKNFNKKASEELFKQLGVEMKVPEDMGNVKLGEDFFWASNDGLRVRTDLVVYAVPYKDLNELQLEQIVARRDSVMKENIPGAYDNTYMTTSKYVPVDLREKSRAGKYMAEARGLWEVKGDAMGGPFVSHTIIDEVNQRIITAEMFVYAPEKSKRNILRKAEATLYTLKLPQEHVLPEVMVLPTLEAGDSK